MFTGMHIFIKEEWIRTAGCLLLRNVLRVHSSNILHHRRKDVHGRWLIDGHSVTFEVTHISVDYERPRLGCRVIVQRNFHKFLPSVLRDLSDWTVMSRTKVRFTWLRCMQLVFSNHTLMTSFDVCAGVTAVVFFTHSSGRTHHTEPTWSAECIVSHMLWWRAGSSFKCEFTILQPALMACVFIGCWFVQWHS